VPNPTRDQVKVAPDTDPRSKNLPDISVFLMSIQVVSKTGLIIKHLDIPAPSVE